MAGKVVGVFGKAVGELGGLVASGIKAAMDIVQDVLEAAQATAKSILSISQLGGYSVGTASNLVSTMGIFGMNPQQTAGRFSGLMSPLLTAYGTQAIGMPNIAERPEDFLRAGARGYEAAQKGGPLGIAQFRMTLNAGMGAGSDEQFIPMFGLGSERINKVLNFKEGLGMSPAAVDKFGKDMTVLQGMISSFAEFLKVQLGTALLPILETGLSKAVEFIKANQQNIIDGIWNTVEFLYAKLPTYLATGFQFMLEVVDGFLTGFSGFVRSIADGSSVFHDIVRFILRGIDTFVDGMRGFLEMLIDAARVIALLNPIPGARQAGLAAVGSAAKAVGGMDTDLEHAYKVWWVKNQPKVRAVSQRVDAFEQARQGAFDNARKRSQDVIDGEQGRAESISLWRQIAENTQKTAKTNEESLTMLASMDQSLRQSGLNGIFDPRAVSFFQQFQQQWVAQRNRALQNSS